MPRKRRTAGPLNDLAKAIANCFQSLGLATKRSRLSVSKRNILAHPPGTYPDDNSGVGPNWIGVELRDDEDIQVSYDIYIGGDAPVYRRECIFQDFDPEVVIPDLVQKFQDWLSHPENIPADPDE